MIDRIAEGKAASRLAYGTRLSGQPSKSVVTKVKYLTIPVLLKKDKVASRLKSAWFAPDRECKLAIALLDAFCQEDGQGTGKQSLNFIRSLGRSKVAGTFEIVIKRSLADFGWAHNPHAIKRL